MTNPVNPIHVIPGLEGFSTLAFAHQEIHEGNHYFLSDNIVLGIGGEKVYLIVPVANTPEDHVQVRVSGTQQTEVELYEGTTFSARGTKVDIFNRNRKFRFSNQSNIKVFHTPTITDDGTLISEQIFGVNGTGQSGSLGYYNREGSEIILDGDLFYLLKLKSTGASNNVSLVFDWYEHDV